MSVGCALDPCYGDPAISLIATCYLMTKTCKDFNLSPLGTEGYREQTNGCDKVGSNEILKL